MSEIDKIKLKKNINNIKHRGSTNLVFFLKNLI